MESIVIWGVIWAALVFFSLPLSVLVFGAIGIFISDVWDHEFALIAGTFIGYLVGVSLVIFSIIQVIFHTIALIQVIS